MLELGKSVPEHATQIQKQQSLSFRSLLTVSVLSWRASVASKPVDSLIQEHSNISNLLKQTWPIIQSHLFPNAFAMTVASLRPCHAQHITLRVCGLLDLCFCNTPAQEILMISLVQKLTFHSKETQEERKRE